VKLDIGAGPIRHASDFKTVDAFTGADIRAEMWALPLADASVDEIWSSHALEHVPLAQVAPTLAEWFRVLRPGGTAVIQVPNLDYACRYWLDHPGETWAQQIIFGNQAHEGEFHKTGWSLATFRAAIEAAGFVTTVETTWDYEQETLRAEAHKKE
jgi:predicted SAM-dependent methyltransferase